MTEVLMKTWKGDKLCNQACVERRPSNAVRKREKMRNAHISEMRSKELHSNLKTFKDFKDRYEPWLSVERIAKLILKKSVGTRGGGWFFIFRSFGDEFRSIFGDILSYLSSNIGNEGKTFNSSCNTDHRRNNFESDVFKRLCYFPPSESYNIFPSSHSCNVIYQLQTVSSRQEKS
jgi:hypothetical protein